MLPRAVVRGHRNPLHSKLPERLRKIRKGARYSGSALSTEAELARNAVRDLERAARVPRVDTLERVAAALAVSPAWLAFGEGDPQPWEPSPTLCAEGVGERLREARMLRGYSVREVGRLSGTSDTLVRMTETGQTLPNIGKVEALADALSVSPGWLAFGIGPMQAPARRTRAASASEADPP